MTRYFALQTSLPLTDCRQNLERKLHLNRMHSFYSITATIDRDDNRFRVVVSDKNLLWGGKSGLFGAAAKGYFENDNGKTVIHGETQNLNWQKLWVFWSLVFIVGLAGALIVSQDTVAVFALAVMLGFGLLTYRLLTQQFRAMLLDAIAECLFAEVPSMNKN